jgi:hypothetical protein
MPAHQNNILPGKLIFLEAIIQAESYDIYRCLYIVLFAIKSYLYLVFYTLIPGFLNG